MKYFFLISLSVLSCFFSFRAQAYEFKYDWCDFKYYSDKEPIHIFPEQIGIPAIAQFHYEDYNIDVVCQFNNTHIIPDKKQICNNRKNSLKEVSEEAKLINCLPKRNKNGIGAIVLSEIPYKNNKGNFLNTEFIFISHRNSFSLNLTDFSLSEKDRIDVWKNAIEKVEWVGDE